MSEAVVSCRPKENPSAVKQRLVYILHDIVTGGVEVALLSAVPALCHSYELKVVVLGKVNQGLIANFTPSERKVFQEFDSPLYLFPFKIPSIVRYINRFSPDIVVSSLWKGSLMGALLKKRMPGVRFCAFIHSTKFFHVLDAFCTGLALRRADEVFVDAVSTAEFVKARLTSAVQVKVVSFLTHPTPQSNPRLGTGRKMGETNVRFLFLGRIYRVKNLPVAIEVIRSLHEQGIRATLDVYGRAGEDYARSCEKVKALHLEGLVTFKGEIDLRDRFALFKDYDFLIQLSAFEGMAMSVAEAMQNGLVPFVTAVGEIPHYAQDDKSALFAEIENDRVAKISLQKLTRVIKDAALYERISRDAFQVFCGQKSYADSLMECLSQEMPMV